MCRCTFHPGPRIRLGALLLAPVHSQIRHGTLARERDEPLNGDGSGVESWGSIQPEQRTIKSV